MGSDGAIQLGGREWGVPILAELISYLTQRWTFPPVCSVDCGDAAPHLNTGTRPGNQCADTSAHSESNQAGNDSRHRVWPPRPAFTF